VYRIAKAFTFEAAHHLGGLPDGHQCGRVHGHSYRAEIHIAADDLDATGFVIDFGDLAAVREWINAEFDHQVLNDTVPQPTSELLAERIHAWATEHLPLRHGVYVEAVRVAETGSTWAEYRPPSGKCPSWCCNPATAAVAS
jgi:6-pyruvoyltetrahydropterin/6-carboxytetrahydropterin synthase